MAAKQHGSRNLLFEIQDELARATPRRLPPSAEFSPEADAGSDPVGDLEFLGSQLCEEIAQNKRLTEKNRHSLTLSTRYPRSLLRRFLEEARADAADEVELLEVTLIFSLSFECVAGII